ncbi:MAG: hypothetical protein IKO43_06405 [Kiritimatiellae bacterium]|nr:hypothetical protein [Kiritimatiellia bacterium]
MTKDLEETLAGLGPGCAEVVARLERAYCPDWETVGVPSRRHCAVRRLAAWRWRLGGVAMAAASAFAALALLPYVLSVPAPVAGGPRSISAPAIYTAAYGGPDAADSLVRSQSADGSWCGSDFITRQNAAALRGVSSASVAYRKALRYLRTRGLAPLTDEELRQRASAALGA